MNFDNSYAALPEEFFTKVTPDQVPAPAVLGWNHELANDLGFGSVEDGAPGVAGYFSGNHLLPGAQPVAMVYAGHQFGRFAPQLGDGRAVLLGEVVTANGDRLDVQLKGSGPTPYSRRGDGKSWLGPALREYILSEAMYQLGVPTTRALAVVATGETVFREYPRPGAVFTRVAASHLRVGTFEYFAARQNEPALRRLADYAIARHYPEAVRSSAPYVALLRAVAERQAQLVAHWMSLGFIHGVMNTDNTAISGETIDYGPAAYIDEFKFAKVFSSIDQQGRYAYVNQPAISQWNLARFAEALLVLDADKAALESILGEYPEMYKSVYLTRMRPKLGLVDERDDDADLIQKWLEHLQEHSLDFTLSFRKLAGRVDADDESRFGAFENKWRRRIENQGKSGAEIVSLMNSVNPLFIPRNHRVEQAIVEAVNGDLTVFNDLTTVLRQPFTEQSEFAHYAEPPQPHERVRETFCGT